jgi:hypothetical protein
MNNVVLTTPPRTGSTLMYNLLKHFTNKKIIKSHNGFPNGKNAYNKEDIYIVTLRNPFDSVISHLQCNGVKLTNENIRNETCKFSHDYFKHFLNINKTNIHIFYYENFTTDLLPTIARLEKIFDTKLENPFQIIKKLGVENVKKQILKYKDFSEYDNKTNYHGNHISEDYNPNKYKRLLSEESVQIMAKSFIINLREGFIHFMKVHNYEF